MKKAFCLLLTTLFLTALATPSDAFFKKGKKHKLLKDREKVELKGHLCDFVSAPLELPKELAYQTETSNFKFLGFVAGAIEGPGAALNKGVSGLVGLLTFPFTRY